jgi:hypothetical protein
MQKRGILQVVFGLLGGLWFLTSTGSGAAATPVTNKGFTLESEHSLRFDLPQYELDEVLHHGRSYQRPVIREAGTVAEEGEPFLPAVTTFYAIEPGKQYRAQLTVLAMDTLTGVDVIPFQERDMDQLDELLTLKRKGEVYDSPAWYPMNLVSVSDPLTFRDLHLIRVTITPFQYSPAEKVLRVITEATIELVETGQADEIPYTPPLRSRVFEPLYRSLVVNYERFLSGTEYQRPSILYILPANSSSLMSTLNNLFNWRHRLGYIVNYVTTSTTGNTNTEIKNYIQTAYTTWSEPPEFVALVGDASGSYAIPTFHENWSWYNGEGDHPYSTLVGGDVLPEVIVGRLSFSTTTDLATIVNKTVQYESNPYLMENWFTRACMVGDPSPSGVSVIFTKESIRELMEYYGYDDVRTVYTSPFATQMVSNLNDGVSFFNYRGYYGVSGFDSGDINSLNNGFKLTVATVITCGTGSFASGTALSESFIRAGTPAQPKGAVAAVGTATLGTHTMFNNIVDMGFYYGIFTGGLETVGAALVSGKLYLYLTYPTNPNNYVNIFSHWNNLMGDPALRIWTAVPQQLTVTHPAAVSNGTNFVDIHITNAFGNPVQDAMVTILKGTDEIFETAWSDENGNVTLPIRSTEGGEVLVTVSKRNFVPYQGSLQIDTPAVSINVLADSLFVDDDAVGNSDGNGDGFLNGGETVELSVPLHNFGDTTGVGISAVLYSDRPQVTILFDSIYIDSLTAMQTLVPVQPFVFQLAAGLSEGFDPGLRVRITDQNGTEWHGALNLRVKGSQIATVTVEVVDYGDGILNPGESAELQISLSNGGSVVAGNVTGDLTTISSALEITDSIGTWGDILPGQILTNSGDRFAVTASEEIIPGTILPLILVLEGANGFHQSEVISFQVGVADVSDPLGPDEHGYYIYDSGDQMYGNAPYYNWIEIDDRYGGTGTRLNIYDSGNNQDDAMTIDLPFTFKMYGEQYTQVTICTNGWLSLGQTEMASFRNYHIPGPGGPSPMIAGFWDDLTLTNGGRIYTWYDEEGHQFIVEWSRVRTYDKNDQETFEIILRDPQFYFTPTGDGEILIQYHTFNNTSSGNYSGQVHGDYATIGIEDPSGTIGLEYTFNNQYPPAAMPLADETAILITTRGSNIRMRGDVNQDNIINIFDVLTLVDYILDGNIDNLNPYLADMNGDGIVNILDVIGMVQDIMSY